MSQPPPQQTIAAGSPHSGFIATGAGHLHWEVKTQTYLPHIAETYTKHNEAKLASCRSMGAMLSYDHEEKPSLLLFYA